MDQYIEHVVLVNELNQIIGTTEKQAVHSQTTPLHRGFSVFIFNPAGEVLLQQRSSTKKTWPLVWAGSCCGHPQLNESDEQAIRRRVSYELGINSLFDLLPILPHFRYQCMRDGIMENEICPVWVARTNQSPQPNSAEVADFEWLHWDELCERIQTQPGFYAEWCEEEVGLLSQEKSFHEYCGLQPSGSIHPALAEH